jgi:hypothetical protein
LALEIANWGDIFPEMAERFAGLEHDITAGIHEAEGASAHGKLTNAELGAVHEFGLGVPRRSFLRDWMDENEAAIFERISDAMSRIVFDGADGKREADLIAIWAEGEIKARIENRLQPELSESTKRRRGQSAVPLIDTSQFIGSIRGKAT